MEVSSEKSGHIELRDYQQEMLDRIRGAWGKCRSVMVQMPTGTGKTHLMAEAIRLSLGSSSKGNRCLVVAHRIELIEQIRRTLEAFGIAGDGVRVESIQTLSRHIDEVDFEPGLVVVDEAHHALARTYRMLWERWPEARFLGLTATPCRLNKAGFTDLFDTLLQSWSLQTFIDRGYLPDFEYISASPDSEVTQRVASLQKRGADGDYQTKELATVMDCEASVSHLYETYRHFADGRKGIVYAIDRKHARHISEYYGKRGVNCCVIDSKTPAESRRQLVEDYREGRLQVIVNVDIFSEGFDCPEVEFIQLARPTLSLSKYMQQVGRGMRVTGRKDCVTILDQAGLYQTFGLPTEERRWDLMFAGRMAGRGEAGEQRGIILGNMSGERELVNLEMVRIKRRGETSTGLEVFLKGGRYGVMLDGRVICPAELERVRRLEAPYFMLGIFPYYLYKEKVLVIDCNGRTLKPGLYGNVRQEDDVFVGKDQRGLTAYWDAKGGRTYAAMPSFVHVRGIEMARVGKQLYLRQNIAGTEKSFQQHDVYENEHFTIVGPWLVFQNRQRKFYRICGYDKYAVYIEGSDLPEYRYSIVSRYGVVQRYVNTLPRNLKPKPELSSLWLKKAMIK